MNTKKLFQSGITGIFIGLAISLVTSYLYSPLLYSPLNPHSPVGTWFAAQKTHGALIFLYCLGIWFAIGLLFGLTNSLFERGWSPLKATVCHYLASLASFIPLSLLAGWMGSLSPLVYAANMILEFTGIYILLWITFYLLTLKKIKEINQALQK